MQLCYRALENKNDFLLEKAPEKVLQFGEGNFMRGFVDYFFDILNEKCNFNGKICVVQPIEKGLANEINAQEGLYTLYLRGFENDKKVNEKRIISSISHCINPYENPEQLWECAKNPDLRFITSNTTEAGIVFDDTCKITDEMPTSFPAKLTQFLLRRYNFYEGEKGKGFIILSCELIDDNGEQLKKCVLDYINLWKLPEEFKTWVVTDNLFCSTLVDRIVTGFPKMEKESLDKENGYEDNLLNTAEIFGFWAIEAPSWVGEELPFAKANLPIVITKNHTPYKQRKVRILNGAHTSMVLGAHLCGFKIVRECMDDIVFRTYLENILHKEIIPTLTLPKDELDAFANAVIERFKNPFIDHALLSIALNSQSKWKARVLPSLKAYYQKFNKVPPLISLSLAALLQFYREEVEKNANDEPWVIEEFEKTKNLQNQEFAKSIMSNEKMWGENLCNITGLLDIITNYLNEFQEKGIYEVFKYE